MARDNGSDYFLAITNIMENIIRLDKRAAKTMSIFNVAPVWVLSVIGMMMIIITVYFAIFFMILTAIGFGLQRFLRPIFRMLKGRDL